jgi:hypothetical protein
VQLRFEQLDSGPFGVELARAAPNGAQQGHDGEEGHRGDHGKGGAHTTTVVVEAGSDGVCRRRGETIPGAAGAGPDASELRDDLVAEAVEQVDTLAGIVERRDQ